jgi:uncharacterized protein YndB with AHSA1/START domain
MSEIRAQILLIDFPYTSAAQIVINAPAAKIFNLLADSRSHHLFDGSGTVLNSIKAPERLFNGATFSMAMKIKVPYRMKNTVIAFDDNEKITWCHAMKWTWCYELKDLGNGQTQVTESFDASHVSSFSKWWLARTGAMERNPKWMAKSLVALKKISES